MQTSTCKRRVKYTSIAGENAGWSGLASARWNCLCSNPKTCPTETLPKELGVGGEDFVSMKTQNKVSKDVCYSMDSLLWGWPLVRGSGWTNVRSKRLILAGKAVTLCTIHKNHEIIFCSLLCAHTYTSFKVSAECESKKPEKDFTKDASFLGGVTTAFSFITKN